MSTRVKLLLIGAVLIVVGIITIFLQPDGPAAECATDDKVTSGFEDPEQGCPVSVESFNEMAEYASKPKPFRIAGLVIILIGLGTAVSAILVGRKRSKERPRPTQDPSGSSSA